MWLVLLWVVAWFLYMGIVPGGSIKYKYDFDKKSSFISNLEPNTRVIISDKKYPNMIVGNPAYITLTTPRKFNSANLKMKYRRINEKSGVNQYPVIEAGVLVDNTVWRYDLKPIENEIIDKLALVWDVKREGELLLLQRNDNVASSVNKIYASVENFLEDLPSDDRIALYNYDLKRDYTLEGYRSFAVGELLDGEDVKYTEIDQDIRGTYQLYTYIKNEELDFTFTFTDLNQNNDKDDIDIYFYYENHLIASNHLEDDGVQIDSGVLSHERELELRLSDLPEGAYKIEIKTNDDIVTKKIRSRQKNIVFANRLWLEKEGENETQSLYTNSNVIQANTTYTDSLQTIKAGTNMLDMAQTYYQYSSKVGKANILDTFSEINLERNGVILSGNRVFSFSPEAFFDPNIKKLDKYVDIAEDGIKYILARYVAPDISDGQREILTSFDLTKAYRENGKYSFLISVPGLSSPDENTAENFGIEIEDIEFELKGRSLNEKLKEFFGKNK